MKKRVFAGIPSLRSQEYSIPLDTTVEMKKKSDSFLNVYIKSRVTKILLICCLLSFIINIYLLTNCDSPASSLSELSNRRAGDTAKYHPGFYNFKKSLAYTGYTDIRLLKPQKGLQEILSLKITNQSAESLFWVQRLSQFEYISRSFKSDEILIYCDAYDVLFGLPPDVLIYRFHTLRKPVIFSTEMLCDTVSCRTDFTIKAWFQNATTVVSNNHITNHNQNRNKDTNQNNPYKFLNAGMFMGKASALRKVLLCAIKYASNGRDDQTAFSMCYRDMPDIIGLDHNSLLFGNIPPYDPIFNTAWKMKNRHDIKPPIYKDRVIDTDALSDRWKRILSISPLIHRLSHDDITPAVIHFPGMAYRPNSYIPFNPCQQNLRWRYNDIGSIFFEDAVRPMLFHTIPTDLLRTISELKWRIVIAVTINNGIDMHTIEILSNFIKNMKENQSWEFDYLYIHIQNYKYNINLDKIILQMKETNRISISTTKDASTTALIQTVYNEDDPNTIIITLLYDMIYDNNIIEILASHIMRDPVYVYGFEGVTFDIMKNTENNIGSNRLYRTYMRRTTTSRTTSTKGTRAEEKTTTTTQQQISSINHRQHHHAEQEDVYGDNHHNHISHRIKHDFKVVARSAGNWINEDSFFVDVLLFREGVVYRREFFDIESLTSLIPTTNMKLKTKTLGYDESSSCVDREEVWVAAYMSNRGVPRIQLKSSSQRAFARLLSTTTLDPNPNSNPLLNSTDKTTNSNNMMNSLLSQDNSCATSLINDFKLSWKTDAEEEKIGIKEVDNDNDDEGVTYDPEQTFQEIPPVQDLPGFSWQANWDIATATCPCTVHLHTRITDGSFFLGEGQYMGQNQVLRSTSGSFHICFEENTQICIYDDNKQQTRMHCTILPDDIISKKYTSGSYLAFYEGQLCAFSGSSPYFGGTKDDSGHKDVIWCTSNLKLFSRDGEFKMNKEVMLKDMWSKIYLHVTDYGDFGFFLSSKDSHDMMLPTERIKTFKPVIYLIK
eukprot:gene4461-8887_t